MEKQGSFNLLRSFLGSIAGGLSSLATLPFAKRKTPEAPLLRQPPPPPSPPPFAGFDSDGNNLSKLYPDMELLESRKRARLSVKGLLEEKGDCSNEKQKNVMDLGEPFGEGSGETSYVRMTQVLSHDVHVTRNEFDLSTFGSGVSQGGITSLHTHDQSDNVTHGVSHVVNTALHSPYDFDAGLHVGDNISDEKAVSEHEEMLHDQRDDSDDNLASFRKSLEARRKVKQKKRGQEPMKEEELPRKRVRFGNTDLGLSSDAQSSLTSSAYGTDMPPKKCSSTTKRKRADEAEGKNEKKLRALTLSEKPIHLDGKPSPVGMGGVSTRKRERVDDENAHIKPVEEALELRKAVSVHNLPLNASRKAISKEFSQFGAVESMQLSSAFFENERKKRKPTSIGASSTHNSQNAHIVFKDELSAIAALAHNMKEFNGNILRVTAASGDGTSKETGSAALDDSWSVFIRNIPIDVKDEELLRLFAGRGSLKLDVEAIRVTRHLNTGLGNGTAHLLLKNEADMNRLLGLRQPLKLRERVLRVSRTLGNTRIQQRLTEPRTAKRSVPSDAHESDSHGKRVKLSSPHEAITISKTVEHQEKHTVYTRSKESISESLTEHTGVSAAAVISKTPEHQERRTASTRSKQSSLESLAGHTGVSGPVPHVYTTRHGAASTEQSKNLEESPEAKRKRVENRQRGMSRSKKIRRT